MSMPLAMVLQIMHNGVCVALETQLAKWTGEYSDKATFANRSRQVHIHIIACVSTASVS